MCVIKVWSVNYTCCDIEGDESANPSKVSSVIFVYLLYFIVKEVMVKTLTTSEMAKYGMCRDIRKEYGGNGGAKPKVPAAHAPKVMFYYVCCLKNFCVIGC